jgi:hypothetical protein
LPAIERPLTALLLYMNEIKQHSHQFSQAPATALPAAGRGERASANRTRLRVVKQMSDNHLAQPPMPPAGRREARPPRRGGARKPGVMFASEPARSR